MNGYVKTVQEAFDVYLGDGCPAFIKTVWPSLEEGISIILNAGGIPVLAHPGRYKLPEATPLSQLMKEFYEAGGLGIEVCSGSQRSETEAMLADFARQYGFYASLGSDFHTIGGGRPRPGEIHTLPADLDPVWKHLPALAGIL